MIPKPPGRIKDKATLAAFAAANPRCAICGSTYRLQVHHMGDLPDVHRRSDVVENLMRLCSDCHVVKFHSEARWTKAELRTIKENDHE